ncbi:MAG: hypothetical protein AAF990_04290 [Bacteroidota bacterium]
MKISRLSFLLSLAIVGLLFACDKDDTEPAAKKQGCTTVESDNYDPDAEEDDGSCVPWRDKFIGDYDYFRDCGSIFPTKTGEMSITVLAGEQEIQISFDFDTFIAKVTGQNEFTIEEQSVPNSQTVSGNGTLSNDQFTMSYSFKSTQSSGGTTNCTMTATKK